MSYDPPQKNRVRAQPNTDARILGLIAPGEEVDILSGPQCSNNWVWWQVYSSAQNLTGWTVEGDYQAYWLIPLP